MAALTEADLEDVLVNRMLPDTGYTAHGPDWVSPEVSDALRSSYHEVILEPMVMDALRRLNPDVSQTAIDQAFNQLKRRELPGEIEENSRIHHLLVNGIPVTSLVDGETKGQVVRIIDREDPERNDFHAVNQFTVIGEKERRPDVVMFVNGLPLVLVELKGIESKDGVDEAYNQIQTYRKDIPELFRFNLLNIVSDGILARYGSISATFERYMPWRTITGQDYHPPEKIGYELEILAQGLTPPVILLKLMRYATAFHDTGTGKIKVVAAYHQLHAMEKGLKAVLEAMGKDGRAGVMWHTQGSGKSFLMTFLAGRLITHPELRNPTILVLTDRNDLDNQLFETFASAQDLLRQEPIKTESTDVLREVLNRKSGGVIFSTLQKFQPKGEEDDFPLLTDRNNVIVFTDEAHRGQYGFEARIDAKGNRRYGFAHYVRQAIPNAVFTGFTGTPVELIGRNTRQVFGEYIDVYDIKQAVDDGATVPVHYEARIARLETAMDTEELEAEYEELTEDLEEDARADLGKLHSRLERLIAAPARLDEICDDFLAHRERRLEATDGKVMFVAASRQIAAAMYERVVKHHPEWHSDEDTQGVVKVVMTGSASDPQELQPHVRSKKALEALRLRYQDPSDPFSIVIVVDMWLTGFDAPTMHTIYIDKPLKGHGLMQTITRTNRVFRGKEAGLVVDYIGIGTELRKALQFYTQADRDQTGVDMAQVEAAFKTQLGILRDIFHGLDYQAAIHGDKHDRMRLIPKAVEYVYGLENAKEDEDEGDRRKRSIERFLTADARLQKAFKMAATTDAATQAKDEVSFFFAVQQVIRKMEKSDRNSRVVRERDAAIDQLVNEFVGSVDVVDILESVGFDKPDLSVLDDAFLERFQREENKDFVLEALKKLLNDQIKVSLGSNLTESKKFSERLTEAMKRYHNRSVDSVQVIQELIDMAHDLAELENGDMSPEERAFYAALSDFDKAVEVLGNDELRLIATELVHTVQKDAGVDWWARKQARAKLRVHVKRLLKKHGWPPEFSKEAIQRIIKQAETLASHA